MSKCCICGREFEGIGNSPQPVGNVFGDSDRCCDVCNVEVVIPVRVFIDEKVKKRLVDVIMADEELKQRAFDCLFHK